MSNSIYCLVMCKILGLFPSLILVLEKCVDRKLRCVLLLFLCCVFPVMPILAKIHSSCLCPSWFYYLQLMNVGKTSLLCTSQGNKISFPCTFNWIKILIKQCCWKTNYLNCAFFSILSNKHCRINWIPAVAHHPPAHWAGAETENGSQFRLYLLYSRVKMPNWQ